MARSLPTLELPASLERALERGHPWVYRTHVPKTFNVPPGWVRIKAGRFVGYALWDETSPIALRVFSVRGVPDAAWVQQSVERAWELRSPLREAGTTAFRWLFGEGDGLPGVTVDLYESFAVIVLYASALERLLPDVTAALRAIAPLSGVVLRRGPGQLEALWGRSPPEELCVREYAMRLHADLHAGQKTGLFLDHRENRRFVAGLSAGKRVLNLFAYTGGFSVAAALGGAARVTSVDVAEPSLRRARDNFVLNGLDPGAHAFTVSDVFEFLSRGDEPAYDLVICDPPSFAKSREQLPQAKKAYVKLNARGLSRTARGGLYAAASCTSQVSPEDFRETLAEAAASARRRLQIVHEAGQPLDHPVMVQHPEGRYLKFVVGRVLDPA